MSVSIHEEVQGQFMDMTVKMILKRATINCEQEAQEIDNMLDGINGKGPLVQHMKDKVNAFHKIAKGMARALYNISDDEVKEADIEGFITKEVEHYAGEEKELARALLTNASAEIITEWKKAMRFAHEDIQLRGTVDPQ